MNPVGEIRRLKRVLRQEREENKAARAKLIDLEAKAQAQDQKLKDLETKLPKP